MLGFAKIDNLISLFGVANYVTVQILKPVKAKGSAVGFTALECPIMSLRVFTRNWRISLD